MRIRPFEIERFYDRWEFRAELMLSSSDCETMATAELLALEDGAAERLLEQRLGYTEVAGSAELRAAIAALHSEVGSEDVLTLAAAEEGIFLAYHALVGADDHVIVETPCYGSAIEVARSTGAQVSQWQRHFEDGWAHDLDALRSLLRPNTRMIYLNSPHNPTGTQMPLTVLESIIEICAERSMVLLSDEVYRGLEHDPAIRLPPACDLYEQALSLNTVSKSYGLPGLRIGWLAGRDAALISAIRELKLYTSICSSAPSELLVALALRHSEQLVERSRRTVLANLPLVDGLLERRSGELEWVRPTAGPIGFPRVRREIDVRAWCEEIAAEAGVLLLPGRRVRAAAPRPHRLRPGQPAPGDRAPGLLSRLSSPDHRTFERKVRVRSCWGLPRTCSGVPASTTTPPSMNTTVSATPRAKPISWVTTTIVIPSFASCCITSSTSPTSSGSSADVGSSKSMSFGFIAMARAIATRCCWPPES